MHHVQGPCQLTSTLQYSLMPNQACRSEHGIQIEGYSQALVSAWRLAGINVSAEPVKVVMGPSDDATL